MKNKKVTATIAVELPIVKNLKYSGMPLNIGSLQLKLGDRNFVLDAYETNFTNGKRKGKKIELESELSVDLETFEEGEEYNYNLTEEDLKDKKLQAEFYCSDCDCDVEDAFDYEGANVECTVYVDGKPYEIKVELEV